ncbi:MAG: hypothetical protein H6Q57_49 [Geobacteraceae bacterium]|nr:hypothetical protein [Geobacteraceae bacterium]
MRFLNLPNSITLLRLLLVPLIIYLLLEGNFQSALWLFLLAGISDALDGFIARRFDMRTELGATLDPIADKVLVVSMVFALFLQGLLPIWLMIVVVCRDLIIAGGAIAWRCAIGHVDMAPTIVSKVNTFLQVMLIFLVLCQASGMMTLATWLPALFVLVFLTSVISGIQYVVVWSRKALQESNK